MAGIVIGGNGIGHASASIDSNGINTTYTITHNLGSRRLIVQVWDSDTFEKVIVDIDSTGNDTVDIIFATPPAADKNYYVNIISHMKVI